MSVLKVALEIYNGDLKGYAKVPDEKSVRENQLKGYMQDLIKTSIETVIYKFRQASKSDYEADSIVIKVAIEFCLNIGATEFLFTQILELFKKNGFREKLIENLEPFIISGAFRNDYIPEDILK